MSKRCWSAPPTGWTNSPARSAAARRLARPAAAANATLVERLSSLAESMRTQQTLLARLAEHSIELRGTVTRLSERGPGADSEALVAHQRNIETNLARLVEESVRSRVVLTDELRGELRLLARTMAGRSGPPAG
jgi:hypothetical protein